MQGTAIMNLVEDGLSTPTGSHDFDALFRDERDGVYRTMLAFTGGRADVAEEATAEAFARAYERRGELRDPTAWIYRAAFRVAIDEIRRDGRRGEAGDVEIPGASPELADLIVALRALSPNQRAAIVLRHVADLDMGEIARRMGTATPTERVHLHRGRARLRELLGAEEVD
jgi:RNA polymerase sigma-70 factor (ECF subfamily)